MEKEQIKASTIRIENILRAFHIPFQLWEPPETKTPAQLQEEIDLGLSELVINKQGLMRKVRSLRMLIYDLDYHKILARSYRTTVNGIQRIAGDVPTGKILWSESPEAALQREILSQLSFHAKDFDFRLKKSACYFRTSISYPGLLTNEVVYTFRIDITGDIFLPDDLRLEDANGNTSQMCWESHARHL